MVRRSVTQVDTDGLQADVMRFMAIIAFVLIAILALVDQMDTGEVVDADHATPALRPTPTVIEVRTESDVEPVVAAAAATPAEVAPVTGIDTAAIEPILRHDLVDVAAEPTPSPMPSLNAVRPATSTNASMAQQDPGGSAVQQPTEDGGSENFEPRPLYLRFDSDEVFSSLIASERIQVFAHTALGYVSLNPSFRAVDVSPRGEVYELMAASVPRRMKAALGVNEEARFVVALSDDTRRAINRLQHQPGVAENGGTLVIQKNGLVRHES